MSNPRRSGRGNHQLSVPPNPPTRAPSTSTAQSGQNNPYTTHTPSHYESESTLPQSLSPSPLNPSAQGSGHSSEYQAHRQQYQQPLQPLNVQQIPGRPIVARPQNLDLGQLPGYGFPPGGPLVLGWPNPTQPQIPIGGFSTYYEPQGELHTQLESQLQPQQDFVSPIPVPPRRESAASGQGSFDSRQGIGMVSTVQTSSSADMSSRAQGPSAIITRAGQKRKADSRTGERRASTAAPSTAASPSAPEQKRPSLSRPPATESERGSPRVTRSQRPAQPTQESEADDDDEQESEAKLYLAKQRQSQAEASSSRRIAEVASHLTTVLPAGKVFPIQIGSDLFRLSGASISSDAPSYFSHYFGEQLIHTGGRASQVKTLYIDRDPETFKDIALHLQGYYVKPRNEEHFVRLFADAQFYSLPRLTQQLFKSEIFIQVGERHFQIPRDIFSSPGDSPNFFSLGFAHFFSTPSEVFPGLDRQTLLRPPSILPPSVANRSGDVFADLLRILQGYNVNIRDAGHRAELLRDARYFHLKGVEQKLIPCEITYNVLRGRSEMLLRLEDIRQSGVNFLPDPRSRSSQSRTTIGNNESRSSASAEPASTIPAGWITYQRPYVDDAAHELILEISSSEATRLDLASMRAAFSGQIKARISSLFSVIANKLNLPAMVPLGLMMMKSGGGIAAQPASPANSGVSGDKVRIRIDRDAFVTLDNDVVEWDDGDDSSDENSNENMTDENALPKVRKWKRERALNKEMEWLVQRGQWRLRVEAAEESGGPSKVEVVLCAIKLEGYTREMHRNGARGFLS